MGEKKPYGAMIDELAGEIVEMMRGRLGEQVEQDWVVEAMVLATHRLCGPETACRVTQRCYFMMD